MTQKIKLAAIHSKKPVRPIEATLGDGQYDIDILRDYKEKSIEKMCAFMHEAGKKGIDLVCTHECFDGTRAGALDYERRDLYMTLVDRIPGPIFERFSEISKKYNMNIVANYLEKEDDRIYNTSILIDRAGKLVGKYRKIHLPPRELWSVTPGAEFTVLHSDIGMIGFATCYDITFPEHCRAVALNGADIIIHQTAGWGKGTCNLGEAIIRTRAVDNGVYMIVAKNIQNVSSKYGKSCIIDNRGEVLAEASGEVETIACAELVPDFDPKDYECYNTLFSGVESVKARSLLERKPSLYKIISDSKPPVLDKYKGVELLSVPGKIEGTYKKWKKYKDDIKSNRPVERKYHW